MMTNAAHVARCPKCESTSIFTGYCAGEEYRVSHSPGDTLLCVERKTEEHLHRTCICGYEWIIPCADAPKEEAPAAFSLQNKITGQA